MNTAIQINNLQKNYGSQVVLKNITFSVQKGEKARLLPCLV